MPFDPNFDDFVSADTYKAFKFSDGGDKVKGKTAGFHVLWGDGVRILDNGATGPRAKIRCRGQEGWIDKSALGGTPLLEVYFIDVGQGDGILIRTPDFRHIMLDGGYPRDAQPHGKSAADFVDWKFFKDYQHPTIVLDEMISSHIDFDHYGGLADILNILPTASDNMDCTAITVDAFYHSGLAQWIKGKKRDFGPFVAFDGKKWFTRLLGDRDSATAATSGVGDTLQGSWGALIEAVLRTKTATGAPTPIARVSQKTGWLPDYPEAAPLSIRVLGPVEGDVNGAPALRRLGSEAGVNSNGTSVLLRIDFGKARILMTGDLNLAAHHALLELHEGNETEFACDVGKCCHHGSEDVSFEFLSHMKPACTIISSGDHEGHDHPRPRIVAASGLTGFVSIKQDKIVTPLVYSTELARSVELGHPETVVTGTAATAQMFSSAALGAVRTDYRKIAPGAPNPGRFSKTMDRTVLVHKMLYGLVNIRTDGTKILAATMNEGDNSFAVKSFEARF